MMPPENGGHEYMCDMQCRSSPILTLWALRVREEGGVEKGRGGGQKEQREQTMGMDIYGWNCLGSEENRCKSFAGLGETLDFTPVEGRNHWGVSSELLLFMMGKISGAQLKGYICHFSI